MSGGTKAGTHASQSRPRKHGVPPHKHTMSQRGSPRDLCGERDRCREMTDALFNSPSLHVPRLPGNVCCIGHCGGVGGVGRVVCFARLPALFECEMSARARVPARFTPIQ
eukprot:829578-Prymnesium_polylepis.1